MAKKVILTQEDRVGDMCFDGQLFYSLDDEKRTAEVNRAVLYVREVEIPEEIQIGETIYIVNSIGYGAFMTESDWFGSSLTSVIIPDTVTIIKSHAFSGCDNLKYLSIGKNVEEIGGSAFFWCNSLKSIQIPNSVKKIGSNAFDSHPNVRIDVNLPKHLRNYFSEESPYYRERPIVIDYENKNFVSLNSDFEGDYVVPEGITKISRNAFYGCTKLTSVSIPDSVVEIGESAFYGCSNLTKITIPNSVNSIGCNAFEHCENLTTLIVCEKVKIGLFAFTGCKKLKERFYYDDGIYYELYFHNHTAIAVDSDKSYTNVVIPSEVTVDTKHYNVVAIGDGTFYGCKKMKSVKIPESVKIIGHSPFSGCESLTEITIESTIKDFDQLDYNRYLFNDCVNLETLIVPHKDSRKWAGLYGGYNLKSVSPLMDKICVSPKTGKSTIVIPEGVSYIGRSAYAGYDMSSIVLPDSVVYIDSRAFQYGDSYGCEQKVSNLESIIFSKNLRYIAPFAFYGHNKLKTIELPNTIDYIGRYAFWKAEQMDTVTMGKLPIMGDDVFDSLKTLILDNDACNAGNRHIHIHNKDKYLYDNEYGSPFRGTLERVLVKDGHPFYDSRNGYNGIIETSTNTLVLGLDMKIPNGIEHIGPQAFNFCHRKRLVSLPESVKTIDMGAFRGAYIKNLNKVKRIGAKAFAWSHTTSLVISEYVEEIDDFAFECSKLKTIYIGRNVKKIGIGILSECKYLKSIVVDEANPYYDSRNNCNAIIETSTNTLIAGCKNTIIPDGVTAVAEYAFYNIGKMSFELTIPDSVRVIKNNAFLPVYKTHTVNIGNGVTEIGSNAICGSHIHHIKFGENVEKIGEGAFCQCSLKSIFINSRVKEIGQFAFYSYKLTNICVDKNNKVFDSRNNCNAIIETATNKLILGCRNTIVPEGITIIGENAFRNAHSIILPESVTMIEDDAFAYSGLQSIIISRLVKHIGRGAFACFNGVLFSKIEDPRQCMIQNDAFYSDAEEIYREDRHSEAMLIVPTGTTAVYSSISPWKEFHVIQEMDVNDMDSSQKQMIKLHQEQMEKERLQREEEMRNDPDKPVRKRR